MRLLFLLAITLALGGCCPKQLVVVDRDEALVAVSSCKAPPDQQAYVLPISTVTADTKNSDLVKKYAATIEMLKGEIKARDLILDGYRKTKDGTGTVTTENKEKEEKAK